MSPTKLAECKSRNLMIEGKKPPKLSGPLTKSQASKSSTYRKFGLSEQDEATVKYYMNKINELTDQRHPSPKVRFSLQTSDFFLQIDLLSFHKFFGLLELHNWIMVLVGAKYSLFRGRQSLFLLSWMRTRFVCFDRKKSDA